MKFGYTIIYVLDVAASLSCFEAAFGFARRFLHEPGDYGELESGVTRYLSALLSARGACIEHLAAAYCFLLFMGHELMNGAASQSPLGGGCVGP
jgi:hypothetical protein